MILINKEARANAALARQLRKEAQFYGRIISNKLAQLGFDHNMSARNAPSPAEMMVTGKTKRQQVKFVSAAANEDVIYLRIDTLHLPYMVRETDFFQDWVLQSLSFSCQRRVEFKATPAGGLWFLVNRNDAVGEVPGNFTFKNALQFWPKTAPLDALHFCIGATTHRKLLYRPLSKLPHLMVAGRTGSGKSVFLNQLICGYLVHQRPEDLELIMIDLKGGVELTDYRDIPHLRGALITEPEDVLDALADFEQEILRRQKVIRGHARDLEGWNYQYPDKRMPRIVLIVDELAQIMFQPKKDLVQGAIESFAAILAKSRAVGGHAVLCTQRPSTDVVAGIIKANIDARLAFATASDVDSRVILDRSDASGLEPAGRGIWSHGRDFLPIQAPMITKGQIHQAIKFAKNQNGSKPQPDDGMPTLEDMLQYAIENLGGALPYRQIFEGMDGKVPQAIVKERLISIEGETVEINGIKYLVTPGGPRTARQLEPVKNYEL
jgi:hypothetical protein